MVRLETRIIYLIVSFHRVNNILGFMHTIKRNNNKNTNEILQLTLFSFLSMPIFKYNLIIPLFVIRNVRVNEVTKIEYK